MFVVLQALLNTKNSRKIKIPNAGQPSRSDKNAFSSMMAHGLAPGFATGKMKGPHGIAGIEFSTPDGLYIY
jgi:hypothetical protein